MTKDYVKIAVKYAEDAISGKSVQGSAFVSIAKTFLSRKADKNYIFSAQEANTACQFVELLPHVEGSWGSETIVLHPSHVFFLVNLFGFRNKAGGRMYTTALFCVARKNAKSTLAAAILLYCLCCEDEPGAQIVTAATTGDQARIIFKVAKRMVEKTPALAAHYGLGCYANSITRLSLGANIRPINSKASTQDGLNPSHIALDELHAHPNPDLLNVLKSAAGARKNPLFLFTTTEGYVNAGPWSEQRDFALSLLEGKVHADHYLPVIFRIDEGDDPLDPNVWQKANPLMDVNTILHKEIEKEALEARVMPGRMAEFKIKRVNRSSSGAKSFLNVAEWDKCVGQIDLEKLRRVPCYAGLDLSSTSDISSFRLVWLIGDTYYTWGMRWCPEETVLTKAAYGKEHYLNWARLGLIKQTSGNVIDHGVVRDDIIKICRGFDVIQIAVDDSSARQLVLELIDAGINVMPLYQGAKTYHCALQELEIKYMSQKIVHDGCPVLRWMLSNVVVKYDSEGRGKPDKTNRKSKIDDAAALLMAIERWVTLPKSSGSFMDVLDSDTSC